MSKRSKKILRTYDLHPDGVHLTVDWGKMVIGSSLFIPCINTEEALKQAFNIFNDQKWTFKHKIKIENGILGLRIWRIV
tara:strand:- start:4755 stop:4991 length:237 start_codon:yes stop_codon:yes gene_type:complete